MSDALEVVRHPRARRARLSIDAACGQLAGDVKDRTQVKERIAQQRTIMLRPVNEIGQ